MKEPLIIITGPTAVGKTKAGIHLAKKLQGEIISGDSMQVYQKMDIGTAKASSEERAEVPHHLIDILTPDEKFSASDFKLSAEEAVAEIRNKGKIPIVVGGTGMYIQSLLFDYSFSQTEENPAYRKELELLHQEKGAHYLYHELQLKSPEAAAAIHPNNTRRIIRALEIFSVTGNALSKEEETQRESKYDYLIIGLTMERQLLYDRINLRVDQMIEAGLLREVEDLLSDGGETFSSMKAIGYKELIPYFNNERTLEESVEILKQNSRRFAKRQLTWFRNKMPVAWFDMSSDGEEKIISMENLTIDFLQTQKHTKKQSKDEGEIR